MNPITRFVRSMRSAVARTDAGFESYYGALAQTQSNGGPSASEARRDYQEARRISNRAGLY
jgi:hypothetical protein